MTHILQSFLTGILSGGIYSLISVGLALIFGVIELVNFAHANYLMVALYACYWFARLLGIDPYLTLPLVIAFMSLLGVVSFKGVMSRILTVRKDIQMLATLAVMLILENTALIFFRADYRVTRTFYSNYTINLGPFVLPLTRVIAFVVAMAVCIGLYLFLHKTYLGKSMRAIAQNNRAAQLMGIRLKWTYGLTFTLGIAMTAVAGVLLTPIYSIYPTVGGTFLLPAFVVVVIGGLSSVSGAIVAGLMVGVVESLSAFFFGSYWQRFGYFVMFILVLLLKPNGILGGRKKEGV